MICESNEVLDIRIFKMHLKYKHDKVYKQQKHDKDTKPYVLFLILRAESVVYTVILQL